MNASLFLSYFTAVALLSVLAQQGQVWEKKKRGGGWGGSFPVFHLTSVYLYRPLHCVCSNVFIITPRDIQLFADRNALERGHFTFTKHLLVLLPNPVILQCFIFRATGSNDERSKWKDVRPNGAERDEQIESPKTHLIANFWQKIKREEKSGKAKHAL